jgi:iron(III) transport system permease protein
LVFAIAVSRVWSLLAKLILAMALILVVVWPALATVLEATQAVPKLERAMRRTGWSDAADSLARWRGVEPEEDEPEVGAAMDPVGTAELLRETRGLSRPARLARESIGLVLATASIAMPIGVLLAIVLFRTDAWGRRGLLAIIALAAFVPVPLHATAWLGALGNAGRTQALGVRPILVGRFGAAVVHALAALPWVVLLTGVGLCAVEPELEESALLEFGPLRVLTRITMRRAIGAIAAAALAVAVLTAGDMTVTDLLQVRTYAEEAYVQFVLGRGLADAAVVALPPLLVLGFGIVLVAWALSRLDPARLASAASGARVFRLGRVRVPAGVLLTFLVGNALAFPLYSLIWRAGRVGGRATLGQPPVWSLSGLAGTLRFAAAEIRDPLFASLCWASLAATLATAMAFGLAWAGRHSRAWRWTMLGAMALALATPGPVAGRALVLAYRDLTALYDSSAMVVLAQALRALPYVLLILWPFLRSFPQDYLDAAALDGYGPLGQILRVALPLSARALLAAWTVTLALALGELPATDQVYPPGIEPMPVFLWGLLHTGVESHLSGVALIMLMVIAAAGLAAAVALGWSRAPGRAGERAPEGGVLSL